MMLADSPGGAGDRLEPRVPYSGWGVFLFCVSPFSGVGAGFVLPSSTCPSLCELAVSQFPYYKDSENNDN